MNPDRGYFPAGESVLRRVHGERAVGLNYGQRALMIGAAHPVNFIGTQANTRSGNRPFLRLVHTAKVFEAVFFGTRAEADEMLAIVERMHDRVMGELPEDAGRFAAGTPYSAYDPDLMLWTVAVIADSAEVFYETFCRKLWRRGEGQPLAGLPALRRALRDAARRGASDLRRVPLLLGRRCGPATSCTSPRRRARSRWRSPSRSRCRATCIRSARSTTSSSPERCRRTCARCSACAGHRSTRPRYRAIVTAARGARPVTPKRIRRGGNIGSFEMVARTERSLVASGRATLDERR